MQLQFYLSVFLTSIVVFLSIQDVQSRPTIRKSGMVTLSLKRVQQAGGNVHPLILLQQHINRGQKRLARMTGRQGPTDEQLRKQLEKRIILLPNDFTASSKYSKRYNIEGVIVGSPSQELPDLELSVEPDCNVVGNNRTTSKQGSSPNTLPLSIISHDVGYFATVQIGTPSQDFKILMDSGSADLWVGGEGCESLSGGGCGNHLFLGPQGSSSFVNLQKSFNDTYGTGTAAGNIITDNVQIAGLQLNSHTFGVAQRESVDFSSNSIPFDGLMGLAQSSLSVQKTATPVEAMKSKGLIQEAITSFKISRLEDGKNDGEVTFGGLDSSKFDPSTLVTLPNVSPIGFWQVTMDGVSINGSNIGLSARQAILDTGTTLVVMPPADALAIHQGIDGAKANVQGGFTVPCQMTDSVAFSFGNTLFAIDPRDIAIGPVNSNDPNGDCVSGIAAGNVGGADEWLVGDVFLKNAYFSTNVDKNQIQLAKLV